MDAHDRYEYIDLGLPCATVWTTCNVGTNAPEENGGQFTLMKCCFG